MQKILLALVMAVVKWLLSVASVKRWLMLAGLLVAAAFFLVPLLGVIAIVGAGAAIYLFIQNRKKAEELKRAQEREQARRADSPDA